jgi:hypothetical protein
MSMLVTDLPYFETISSTPLISGAAGTMVSASAFATSTPSYTNARTDSTARALPHGGSVSVSRGFAIAIGNNPNAEVSVAGSGDIVTGSAYSTPNYAGQHVDVAVGVVVAVDLPNR